MLKATTFAAESGLMDLSQSSILILWSLQQFLTHSFLYLVMIIQPSEELHSQVSTRF